MCEMLRTKPEPTFQKTIRFPKIYLDYLKLLPGDSLSQKIFYLIEFHWEHQQEFSLDDTVFVINPEGGSQDVD